MRIKKGRHLAAAIFAAACFSTTHAYAQLAAFPGALGFGADATGGRGGTVQIVSNLNSSGAGSFAAAVSVPNSIVVFTVGGYINLDGEIPIASNVTIEGQTAPGQGIGLMDGEISFSSSSNDIIRDIRIRQGNGSGVDTGKAGVEMDGGSNIIFDHVSVQFGEWDTLDLTNSSNVTVQNSLLTDAIGQQFGIHGQSDTNMTYAYNVLANNHNRNPDIEDTGSAQVINNVVYNVQAGITSGNTGGTREEDVVNNYYITGPSTTSNSDAAMGYQLDSSDEMYASGNMEDDNKNGVLDGSPVSPSGTTNEPTAWFASTSTMPTFTAANAYSYLTAYAGDSVLGRDSLDSLDISQVESLGTSGGTTAKGDFLYTSPSQSGLSNGGYGTITGGTSPTSSANDGIPDTWATTHGVATWAAAQGTTTMDPAFAKVLDPLGYSEIEDYANSLADQFVSQTWSAASGNWTTAANWNSAVPGIFQHALIRGTGTADSSVTITTSGNLAESLSIGGNGLSAGEQVNVSSGGLTIEDTIFVGDQNNGQLGISGGTVIAANVQLGNTVWNSSGTATNFTGTLNLTGGTLQTGQVVQGAGTPGSWTSGANWTWSGGTLQAGPNGLNVTAPATIGAAGATLDTNGESANMSGVLSGPGNLTKIGVGVATMIRSDSYANTFIDGGALKAHVNAALGTGTVTINVADGLQIQNGVTIPNTIVANGGASEVIDVPDAGASATVSGPISLASQSADQYRVGVSGTNSTLTLTGASTVSTATSLITRGNIIFAGSGSLNVTGDGLEIGRFSSTSTLNFTIENNASVSATSLALGGLDGSSDDLTTVVTVTGSADFSAGTGSLNLDNSATASNTTTLTLSGSSVTSAGSISDSSTATGHATTLDLNGGTILATANNPSGGSFFPVLNSASVNVETGGAIFNNGGFGITIAQPLLGTTGDGGFTEKGAGSITLTGANTYNGPTNITQGTLVIGAASALPAGNNVTDNGSFVIAASATAGNVSGTGQTTVNTGVTFTANNFAQSGLVNNGTTQINGAGEVGPISGTGTLVIGTGTSDNTVQLVSGSGLSNQNSLAIKSGSKLDITNNGILIADPGGAHDDSTMTTLLGYVTSGAITSSAGQTGYGIGVVDGNDGVIGAVTSSGQIEVAYSLFGDANLDGKVDITDFNIFAPNFGLPTTLGWEAGDFNYSGTVDITDFNLFSANFGLQDSGVAATVPTADRTALDAFAAANGLLADVPEPGSAALAALTAVGLTRRRRRSGLVNH